MANALMVTERELMQAAHAIADYETNLGRFANLDEMHEALTDVIAPAKQHEVIKWLNAGHGAGAFYLNEARK